MIQALLIDPSETFQQELDEEDSGRVLSSSSGARAAEWLNDASLPLSAIFLNPNDASYSALKFLGHATKQRPATPIFVLDCELGSRGSVEDLVNRLKVRDVLSQRTHFKSKLGEMAIELPLSLQKLNARKPQVSPYLGYQAVPIIDFIFSGSYSFDVYCEAGESVRFFAREGERVDWDYLSTLSQASSFLYIEEGALQRRHSAVKAVENAYLNPALLSPAWRNAETLFRASALLEELRAGGASDKLVNKTYALLEDLFQLTTQLTLDEETQNLLNQAKRCDRAISCAVLCALFCKKLKFDRTAIVETLGFASLLQDISLYQSPFGDLSRANPEELPLPARAYFQRHPLESANLVAGLKDIPDVTLQIIKQQHERTDRTGYPGRVGGAQLQPLAEILSLVNSFLDRKGSLDFVMHYSERLVVPFMKLVSHSLLPTKD